MSDTYTEITEEIEVESLALNSKAIRMTLFDNS